MKRITLIVIAIVLAGCSLGYPVKQNVAADIVAKGMYVSDPRTGLCFLVVAGQTIDGVTYSVTNVPCAPVAEAMQKGKISLQ